MQTRPRTYFIVLAGLLTGLCSNRAFALSSEARGGYWPRTWPEELEPYRERAQTEVGNFNVHERYTIPFSDRADFEQAWPSLLQIPSKGAPLTLRSATEGSAAVRICLWMIDGRYQGYSIELHTEGKVIDLSRIRLPAETSIIDQRELPTEQRLPTMRPTVEPSEGDAAPTGDEQWPSSIGWHPTGPTGISIRAEDYVALTDIVARGHIVSQGDEFLRCRVSYVVHDSSADRGANQLARKEINVRYPQSHRKHIPTGKSMVLFISRHDGTEDSESYDAAYLEWCSDSDLDKKEDRIVDMLRTGQYLAIVRFPAEDEDAIIDALHSGKPLDVRNRGFLRCWPMHPGTGLAPSYLNVPADYLIVRATLVDVDDAGSSWKVVRVLRGKVAQDIILLDHDQFRARAEAVVRQRNRKTEEVPLKRAPFDDQVQMEAARMRQAELPKEAIGEQAILFLDESRAEGKALRCRLRKWVFREESDRTVDKLGEIIRVALMPPGSDR